MATSAPKLVLSDKAKFSLIGNIMDNVIFSGSNWLMSGVVPKTTTYKFHEAVTYAIGHYFVREGYIFPDENRKLIDAITTIVVLYASDLVFGSNKRMDWLGPFVKAGLGKIPEWAIKEIARCNAGDWAKTLL